MEKFQPFSLDYDVPAQGELLGDVKAGFPSPAEDIREKLDLIKLLVRHKASTFFFRVSGVSMVDADMDEGDIIIVDRAVQPYNNCKAVCFIDGEYTVKRIEIGEGQVRLMPANEKNTKYQPIEITPENNFMVWGVVTYVIKKMSVCSPLPIAIISSLPARGFSARIYRESLSLFFRIMMVVPLREAMKQRLWA